MATVNLEHITNTMMDKDHRLWRNYKNGKKSVNGFLDDYAFTIKAILKLYENSFEEKWLTIAQNLVDYVIEHFSDDSTHLFFFTSDQDPKLITRKKDLDDNVIPSSNSTMAYNLLKIGTLLDHHDYISRLDAMINTMAPAILKSDYPAYYAGWNLIYTLKNITPFEIAILGKDSHQKSQQMKKEYIPNAVWLGSENKGTLELLKDRLVKGKTMIYVCQNKVCKFPVEDVDKAMALIE